MAKIFTDKTKVD